MKSIFLSVSIIFGLLAFQSCEKLLDWDEPGNLVPATVIEDPLLPSINIGGTLFHAEAFGDIHDPIIIFLHGGPGGDYRAFISQFGEENASRYPQERSVTNGGISLLQDEYYCVFYDQRGAGLSPRFDIDEIDFDTYLEDLDGVIDYYLNKKQSETGVSASNVYLFAWSFGGILATGYINKFPGKVKDIVFYEPGPFTPAARDYFVQGMTSVFGQVGDEWLEDYLMSHDHMTPDSHVRGDYQLLLGAFRSQPEFHQHPDCPVWRFGSLVSKANLDFFSSEAYDISSNLIDFEGRTLFLAGSLTVAEFPDYMTMQQNCYPDHSLEILPNTGHTGPWEKPGEIVSRVRSFFK